MGLEYAVLAAVVVALCSALPPTRRSVLIGRGDPSGYGAGDVPELPLGDQMIEVTTTRG